MRWIFVGRFETLEEDWARLCEKLSLDVKLPHRGKRRDPKHYREYYDEETRRMVEEVHAVDLEKYGYSF